jgi:hypothetical protein
MSMPILDQLPLLVSRHASTYAAARLRIAELAPYATLDALTHVLTRHGRRPAGAPEDGRFALLSALVVEAQRSSHPLWTSLLMWAFKPMLRGARRRTIPCRGDTPEDLDQRGE